MPRSRHRSSLLRAAASAVTFAIIACAPAWSQTATYRTVTADGSSRTDPTNNPIPVPPGNSVFLGAHIDWDWEQPQNLSRRFGYNVLSWSLFLPFPLSETPDVAFFNKVILNQPFPVASADGKQRPQLMLTLEPTQGALASVTDEQVARVVDLCRTLNEKGVAVMLRFAHEMNGWWSNWGMRPTEYKATFRKMAVAVRACKTCGATAMFWAPQVGNGYPWGVDIPLNNSAFFVAHPDYAGLDMAQVRTLDTNGDGKIGYGDEPYEPYWPGDDVVDWVGLSIYYAGREYGTPGDPYPKMFENGVNGKDYQTGADNAAPPFYQYYSVNKNKPFCLAETSLQHINFSTINGTAQQNAERLRLKQLWWRQTIANSVFDAFPNYRSTWLFEWIKVDTLPNVPEDFSYTLDQATRDAFKADLPASRIVWANATFVTFVNFTSSFSTLNSNAPALSVSPTSSTTKSVSPTSSATSSSSASPTSPGRAASSDLRSANPWLGGGAWIGLVIAALLAAAWL